jgi:uncharacterized membrane protein YciS (DUF1049 family)
MSFEILQEKEPSYSGVAMVLSIILSVMLLGAGVAFAYLMISGEGGDYLLGTLLASVFLIAGIDVVIFARYFSAFREVAEDREEELLW